MTASVYRGQRTAGLEKGNLAYIQLVKEVLP
jgi:hypothetical protein